MAGNIKEGYQASTTLTVTNLHSLASSQDWLTGWGSNVISNTTDLHRDFLVGLSFTTNSANRQAGFINVYIIPALDSIPTFPAVASGTLGTEGAISFTDSEERDSICKQLGSIAVDNTASAIVAFAEYVTTAIKRVPGNFVIFVSQNAATTTAAGLAASGSTVKVTGQFSSYT